MNNTGAGAISYRVVLFALLCAGTQALFADTGVAWTNVTAFTVKDGIQTDAAANTYWGVVGNWTDAGGAVIAVAPTNAADRFAVTLPALGTDNSALYRKTISTKPVKSNGKLGDLAVNPSVASITGGERYTIRHAEVDEAGTIPYPTNPREDRLFTVENPNAFTGFWEMQEPYSQIFLGGADGTFKPVLWNLDLLYRARVGVPAGGTGRIEALAGDGVLVKTEAGTLEFGTTSGEGNGLFVEGGTLRFDGVAADGSDLRALLAKASLHLDATVEESLVTSNGAGRVCVTRWNDVRGNGKFAYVPTSGFAQAAAFVHSAHAPYVAAETSPTGCRLLDFGAALGDGPEYGPTNCFLRFEAETVREVFYVARYKVSPTRNNAVISSSGYPLHMSGRRLISPAYANYGVRAGDLMINGRKFGCAEYPRANEIESLYVFSAGSLNDIVLSTLATDREESTRTGGQLIGEVILFDQPLTRAERVAVNRYLLGKWRSGAAYDRAFGAVRATDDLTVDVPEGRTVSVGEVALASGKKLVKTGAGQLEIGTLTPANATVDVRGGVVKFSPTRLASVPTAPVAGSLYWFDGSAESDFTFEADETHISGWKDREHAGVVATIKHGKNNTAWPKVLRNAFGTRSAVSFGTTADDWCFAQLPNWNDYTTDDVSSRSGFIAFRFNTENSNRSFIGSGSKRIDLIRVNRALLSTSYFRSRPSSANWTINGVPTDPWAKCADGEPLYQTNDFVVVSFDSSLGQFLQGLAVDRNADNSCGGVTIGEVITYNRRLSSAERLANEAYLMNKWQGRNHPAATQAAPQYVFSPDEPVAVSSDADVTLATVAGNGSVFKDGAGTLTLPTDARETNRASVAVLGGTLATSFADNFVDRSFLRFDASRVDKMTYYTSEDGVSTNVTDIYSVHNSSLLTTAKGKTGNAVTNPALVTVEMRTGVNRPCLDFGLFNNKSGDDLASALQNSYGNPIVEFHVVYADKLAAKNPTYQSLFCSYQADYYMRDSVNLLSASAPEYARTGYLAVDGCETSPDTPLPAGFHLVSAAPNITDDTKMIYPTMARSARGCGGCQIAELVLYNNTVTNTPKERAYLEEQLMHKWFDAPLARWPYGIGRVEVASGATWRDTSASVRFAVGELALRGTAEAAEIRVGESASVGTGGRTTGDLVLAAGATVTVDDPLEEETPALTVEGALTFTGKLVLDILPDWTGDRLDVGTYPLVRAESFVRTDSASPFGVPDCEFTCSDALVRGRDASLVYDATTKTLLLSVRPKGALLIVR